MSTHELLEPLLRLPRRLTLQLSLLLTVLLVAGIGAHAWITAETQGARLHASIRAHAAALAATVAADAAPLLVLSDYAALEEQLLRAAALPDVLAIRVLDSTGQVVSNVLADADGAPRPDYTPLRLTPPTPDRLVQEVDALVLSGGSAFGLDAASGVADTLRAMGRGFDVGGQKVPIVPGELGGREGVVGAGLLALDAAGAV